RLSNESAHPTGRRSDRARPLAFWDSAGAEAFMDRNRDLSGSAGTAKASRTDPPARPGHIHRGLAQVDMGVATPLGGRAAAAEGGQREGRIRTRLYQDGSLVKENFPVDEISDHLGDDSDCGVGLDPCAPDREQLGS